MSVMPGSASQPGGQQPSPPTQAVIAEWLHTALQVAGLPVIVSIVQELPSLQFCGQLAGGSQVSPASTTPLPQLTEQSLSLL